MGIRKADTRKAGVTLDLGEGNPKQNRFYMSRVLYTAYGGAKGGGKTHAVRTKAAGGAVRWPGIRILIVRRTYPELQQNHIEPLLKTVPPGVASYNSALHTLYFGNGSMIKFGHYQSATAEQEYQGQEYDWIFMDEATQFTEREFRYLGACLRGVSDIPKRFYITCNPGGVGHRWVKRLFIDREYRTSFNPEESENPADYAFIFATVEDNAHLTKSSPSYLSMLSSLPENMRRAYRYGDWDALSGAYFAEFIPEKHVVRPFPIPETWTRYRAIDYGLDMLACLWIAIEPSGRCYAYREVKIPGLIVSEAARTILANTLPGEQVVATFAPPDIWSRQKDTGRSMAELFAQNGVPLLRSDSGRAQGHMMIKEMLTGKPGEGPGLLVFDVCRELAGDLQTIQADETNPNDCAVQPHEITHTVDALRYFCVSRTGPQPTPRDEETESAGYTGYMTGGECSAGYIGY